MEARADGYPISNVIKDAGLTASTSDARRMVSQGAVRIDSERVDDLNMVLDAGFDGVVQVGKRRIARILIG